MYDGVLGKNSRGASSPFQLPCSVFSDPIHPGITPILPKTIKQPSTRFITGFMKDLSKKRILFQFGFTRDNVG